MFNKQAQVGETVTWVVATVIIIVILGVAIAVSQLNVNLKKVDSSRSVDVLASKSFYGYLQTNVTGGKVYKRIKSEGKLDGTTGNLSLKIFEPFREDYSDVWIGIFDRRTSNVALANSYFGDRPTNTVLLTTTTDKKFIEDNVPLNENKSVEMVLGK